MTESRNRVLVERPAPVGAAAEALPVIDLGPLLPNMGEAVAGPDVRALVGNQHGSPNRRDGISSEHSNQESTSESNEMLSGEQISKECDGNDPQNEPTLSEARAIGTLSRQKQSRGIDLETPKDHASNYLLRPTLQELPPNVRDGNAKRSVDASVVFERMRPHVKLHMEDKWQSDSNRPVEPSVSDEMATAEALSNLSRSTYERQALGRPRFSPSGWDIMPRVLSAQGAPRLAFPVPKCLPLTLLHPSTGTSAGSQQQQDSLFRPTSANQDNPAISPPHRPPAEKERQLHEMHPIMRPNSPERHWAPPAPYPQAMPPAPYYAYHAAAGTQPAPAPLPPYPDEPGPSPMGAPPAPGAAVAGSVVPGAETPQSSERNAASRGMDGLELPEYGEDDDEKKRPADTSCESRATLHDESSNVPIQQKLLDRRARKNSQARARQAKLRERIKYIKSKPESERTEEEKEVNSSYQYRRQKKNNRSRERAIEKKTEIERILAKQESKRTKIENDFLETAMSTRQRKQQNDRLRRQRIRQTKREQVRAYAQQVVAESRADAQQVAAAGHTATRVGHHPSIASKR